MSLGLPTRYQDVQLVLRPQPEDLRVAERS